MKKIAVLGAGMVGSAIAIDLAKEYYVIVIDRNSEALDRLPKLNLLKPISADLTSFDNFDELTSDCDHVVSAVPGFMGFETLRKIIESGKNVTDISFFPEDAFLLDDLAKKKNVTAIVDFGVAPGMSNFILGYYNSIMDVSDFEFYVGGLPVKRDYPYQYKAPFSPVDVIEEYSRNARFVENGKIVVKQALSDREYMSFDEVGTLETFNTDGLRTLLKTMKIPNMKEKTLRYPGHIELMLMLREGGFLSMDNISVNGISINPFDFTTKILFDKWKLNDDDDEFTIMRIIIKGFDNGLPSKITFNLFDKRNYNTNTSSMARTTGYAATAAANLILKGKFSKKGIMPPELIGSESDCFNFVMNYNKERGVNYIKTEN